MNEIFYYEYSDDGVNWTLGEPAFSLLKCIDKARKISYRWRIKKADVGTGFLLTQESVNKAIDDLLILEKLFE